MVTAGKISPGTGNPGVFFITFEKNPEERSKSWF
jgi:hypothetical protein